MKKFTPNDLLFTDYKTAKELNDNPKANPSDCKYLNKDEAYEMAYFINNFMVKYRINDIRIGQKIEAFIKHSRKKKLSHKAWNFQVLLYCNIVPWSTPA